VPSTNSDLDELIREPRESLDVEVKEWLDLSGNHRATLAKEIIALANHGGGHVVVGFAEQTDGRFVAATPPATLADWSQDAVQAIVAKYIDPGIQCRIEHRTNPDTGVCHPIIIVPGGHRVPVRARAGTPDNRLVPHRVYVRRAGPNSEEPKTAEEWDRLMERCLQNRKAELLEAMRSIIAGVIPTTRRAEPSRIERLHAFEDQAIARWTALVGELPEDAPPRFGHGFYDVSFAIDGTFDSLSLTALRTIVREEVRSHSGWPPFLTIQRPPYTPKLIDGSIECWIGRDTDGSYGGHHDFWRISPEGFLFTRRSYEEDGGFRDIKPGTTFDVTTPTWRLGEAILEASYIAKRLAASEADLVCHARWTKLAGRRLVSIANPARRLSGDHSAAQADYETTRSIALAALPEALPELVFAMLAPLYEHFDFFELPKRLVEEEVAKMRTSSL
jgi:hypothetical protein